MNKIASFILFFLTVLTSGQLLAQETATPEMADTMRSEGKIYVVVAILVIIFVGLIAYLISMDRKVARIEKKISEKKA